MNMNSAVHITLTSHLIVNVNLKFTFKYIDLDVNVRMAGKVYEQKKTTTYKTIIGACFYNNFALYLLHAVCTVRHSRDIEPMSYLEIYYTI